MNKKRRRARDGSRAINAEPWVPLPGEGEAAVPMCRFFAAPTSQQGRRRAFFAGSACRRSPARKWLTDPCPALIETALSGDAALGDLIGRGVHDVGHRASQMDLQHDVAAQCRQRQHRLAIGPSAHHRPVMLDGPPTLARYRDDPSGSRATRRRRAARCASPARQAGADRPARGAPRSAPAHVRPAGPRMHHAAGRR